MYEILIKGNFSSAHNLLGYKGKCEELHGHSWKVEARFEKDSLNNIGISVDFTLLKSKLTTILKKIDHTYLNKLDIFKKQNPSAENIAKFIYQGLRTSIKVEGLFLKSVSVWESDTSCATYCE
jgi:6-pyruvoyltetrahydropterin/6-carboxytetrahydropterin synthase